MTTAEPFDKVGMNWHSLIAVLLLATKYSYRCSVILVLKMDMLLQVVIECIKYIEERMV